jgi:hypothetical protein
MILNQQSLSTQSVNAQKIPDEGPKSIALSLDFSQATQYTLDLQNLIQRNFISMIQGIFLDNSANPATLSVQFAGTGQTIKIAPNRQGYRIVLCPNPVNSIAFTSTGGVPVSVNLLNFPVTNSDWPAITGA